MKEEPMLLSEHYKNPPLNRSTTNPPEFISDSWAQVPAGSVTFMPPGWQPKIKKGKGKAKCWEMARSNPDIWLRTDLKSANAGYHNRQLEKGANGMFKAHQDDGVCYIQFETFKLA